MSRSRRKWRVELTQHALTDLRAIERFSIKEWGRKTAEKYLDGIAAALDRLREHPELLHPEPDVAPGLSFYRVKKHVLVCDAQDGLIIVLTFLHTSMELPSRLLELEPHLSTEVQILRAQLRNSQS